MTSSISVTVPACSRSSGNPSSRLPRGWLLTKLRSSTFCCAKIKSNPRASEMGSISAQNFMISMAAIGYDTCPMEGSDTLKVKNILNLRSGTEINMVIGCGIRTNEGIYGDQLRVPFNEVYTYI